MEKVENGKVIMTEITDQHGSTFNEETNYFNGKPELPKRYVYEIRAKVTNIRQEQEEYAKFSHMISEDPKKLDPGFRIERTKTGDMKGYYFVVTKYTVLKY